MKYIGEIIIVTMIAFLMLFGIVSINEKAVINSDLDDESLNLIAQYDAQFEDFRNNVTDTINNNKNLTNYEPDANLIGDFAKDFFETKSRIDQLKSTMNLALNLPDVLFLSIPFIDQENLTLYKQVTALLLIIVLFTAIIVAFFGRIWGDR